MKQKLLATLLAFCLVVGMLPLAASAAAGDVAQIEGGNSYSSLAEAVEAVVKSESKTGTIKLLKDANGSGIGLFNEQGATGVDLTIDFGGFTYTCQDPAVGSTGTESQGFHFEKGNTVTLKNGTIDVDENSQKTKMLIQNYCDLTLENLNLHGSAVTQYMISSNYGDMDLHNVNISGGHNSLVGIDLMHWLGTLYQDKAPTIEIHNTSSNIIEGTIDVYCYGTGAATCPQKPSLKITGGSFSANVSQYVADGYTMIQSGDKYVVEVLSAENAVAQVEGNYYESLHEAINAANGGNVITLLRDTSEARINIEKNIIIDLGTHTWTGTSEDCVFTVPGNHNVTIKNGSIVAPNLLGQVSGGNTIFEACSVTESDCLIVKGGTVLLKDTDITATAADAAGVQVNDGTFTLDADSSITAMGEDYAVGVFVKGTDDSADPVVNIAGTIATYGPAVQGNGSDRSNPEINIQAGATLTAEKLAMYLPQPGTVNITGATVTGYAAIGIKSGTLNITDSVIHGKSNDDELRDEHSNTNGIAYDGSAIVIDSYIGYAGKMNLTISGESQIISDYSTAIHEIGNTAGATNVVSIQVNGGYFSSAANHEDILVRDVTKETVTVSAGYFTSDPSQYLEVGKAAVESNKAGYNYMVTDATETPAEVVPAAPDASVNPDLKGENKTAAEKIQNALPADVVAGDGVTAAANSVANQNTATASNDVLKELNEAIGESGTEATAKNTKIVIQPYMEITIEDVDVQDQTVTLDITPMYRTVATTADLEKDEIVLEKSDDGTAVNAVQIGEEKPLTITKPVTMTLKLPGDFAEKPVYIQHKWYEYSATADDQGKITFTNPHGFSSFTFSTATQAAAKIDGTTYTSLQEAVNHVENGQTIILLKDGTATVDREVSFTIANENSNTFKATLTPGSDYSMTEENGQYTFTKKPSTPVTPGPGDDDEDEFPFTDVKSGAWYYDAVKYVYENGLMAGTSDTTFDPEMKLNRAMAAQILYNLEGKPAVTEAATFTDAAAAGEWALDAIAWAQQTGVVAGMGDNLFAPDAQVTREQFAQMMYNYAKYKGYDLSATGDLTQFSDSSKLQSWAVTAMKWANGNGLINGFEDDTIQPAGTTIRGQAASIIMNFDKNVAE